MLLLLLLLLSIVSPLWHPVQGLPVLRPLLMSISAAAWQRESSGQPRLCQLLVHPAHSFKKADALSS